MRNTQFLETQLRKSCSLPLHTPRPQTALRNRVFRATSEEEQSMRADVHGVQLRVCMRSHESVCKQYRRSVRDVHLFTAVSICCLSILYSIFHLIAVINVFVWRTCG